MANFGRIETCACCGKDTKRPVRFRGQTVGENCKKLLVLARDEICFNGREAAEARMRRDWPRSWARLIAMAA